MGENGCTKYGIKRSENGGCRTFEEELYWTNFKSFRFFQFLSSDFHSNLMIPKEFSENMRDKLPRTVVLKSPGGSAWDVQLVRDNNTLFFKDGWKEFAKAHNFKENDLLVFKYTRDSCFKVWVLSGRNLCEKAGSYFVKKPALGEDDAGENSQLKRKNTGEGSAKAAGNKEKSDLEDSDIERAARASRRKNRRHSIGHDLRENSQLKRKNTREGSAKAAGNKDKSDLEDSDIERASRKKNRRHSTGCDLRNSGPEENSRSTDDTLDRVAPSEADKVRAKQVATQNLTTESFIVVMKPSNVSQYYRMGIPSSWSRDHLARKNQYMELRANGKKWNVRFNVEPRYGGGVLVSGWCKFAVENLLQEFDVCLFKLVSQKDEPVVFDVAIYRAAPEVEN